MNHFGYPNPIQTVDLSTVPHPYNKLIKKIREIGTIKDASRVFLVSEQRLGFIAKGRTRPGMLFRKKIMAVLQIGLHEWDTEEAKAWRI